MALATTVRSGKFKILIGDGDSPEVFSAPCGMTTKSWTRSKSFVETETPDCADPDLPSHIERDVSSLSAGISGSGVMAAESVDMWQEFYDSQVSKNCKIVLEYGTKTQTTTQKYHLESFEVTAEKNGRAQVSINLTSDGAYTTVVTP